MDTKSGVSTIFPHFKKLVETRFQTKIKNLYSDNGGEFIALKSFLLVNGIGHYTTAPHTPQQNGVFERHYRHLVKTGFTLLHDTSLPFSYWPHAFQITSYLINRQPTSLLQNRFPFEALFGKKPNYLKLRKFGCLCYPLTWPYNTHKMKPKSSHCVFIEYSQTQSAYKCLDLKTHKIYISRHVLFDEPNTLTQSSTKPKSQTPESHNAPLFFDAQVMPMPSPASSALLLASTTPEGVAVVDTSSSGNLVNPISSSLPISSKNLGQNSLHLKLTSPSSSPNTCLLDSNSLLSHSSPIEQTIG